MSPVMPDAPGVLLMAYGSPTTLDDVEAYFTHIRGGRTPPPERVEELRERYRRIGGHSPLLEITRRLARGVETGLSQAGHSARVYVGMKHAPPFIADTVQQMAHDGIRHAVGLALAPHFSRLSVGTYLSTASAAAARQGIVFRGIESWHDAPRFIQAVASRLRRAQQRVGAGTSAPVVFTAHSLPQRILEWNDPYPTELQRTCQAIANTTSLSRWQFAYQSASHTGEPWLGPDLAETIGELGRAGERAVIVCPVGFVSDHLEILHDIDVEARAQAESRRMRLERVESLNDGPDFVAALVGLLSPLVAQVIQDESETAQRR